VERKCNPKGPGPFEKFPSLLNLLKSCSSWQLADTLVVLLVLSAAL
jgi:hypothetical protein